MQGSENDGMNTSDQPTNDRLFMRRALEATIRIGLIVLLLYWCFRIGQPFIPTIVWGIIIAVAIHPVYERLKSALGGRGRLAATLITLFALIILFVPTYLLSDSLINSVQKCSAQLIDGKLSIPSPSQSVRSWPIIGEPLYESWNLASGNLGDTLGKMTPQLKQYGISLLSTVANTGVAILMFVVSIIIAGVLLANDTGGALVARALAKRLAGERGMNVVELAVATVRSVTLGILGVALLQAFLAGLGFLVVGVPGAGLWAFLVLILAVIQLPALFVLGPIIAYVFITSSTTTAVVFTIWSILVGISDNFLKPLLMGRGVDVPMLVVFIGAIGGFLTSGIIGLFVGAIILALGYNLFVVWLNDDTQPEPDSIKSE